MAAATFPAAFSRLTNLSISNQPDLISRNPNQCLVPHRRCRSLRCSTAAAGGVTVNAVQGDLFEPELVTDSGVPYPRPQEIAWSKDLANSVRLIGVVGAPVQIKHLASGKTLAWTRLANKKSASDTTWISLTFWDELAHIAFQHVQKGHQIFVSGRLVSDTVGDDETQQKVYYKVVVQQLNFVERSFPPRISLYEPELDYVKNTGGKDGDYFGRGNGSTEELWQAFFANPMDWWDNRKNKRNPKYPDFKHKDTGEALWIEGKYTPVWVKSQLEVLDTRMASAKANDTSSSGSFLYGDNFSLY